MNVETRGLLGLNRKDQSVLARAVQKQPNQLLIRPFLNLSLSVAQGPNSGEHYQDASSFCHPGLASVPRGQ